MHILLFLGVRFQVGGKHIWVRVRTTSDCVNINIVVRFQFQTAKMDILTATWYFLRFDSKVLPFEINTDVTEFNNTDSHFAT